MQAPCYSPVPKNLPLWMGLWGTLWGLGSNPHLTSPLQFRRDRDHQVAGCEGAFPSGWGRKAGWISAQGGAGSTHREREKEDERDSTAGVSPERLGERKGRPSPREAEGGTEGP